jgi:membrane protein involved in colicin uptake
MTPGRGGEALPVALSKHNFTVEDRLEEVRKKDERNKEIELKRIEKNFGRVLEVRAKTQAYKEQIKRLETERLARLEAKSFECAMHRLGTILSWQHH